MNEEIKVMDDKEMNKKILDIAKELDLEEIDADLLFTKTIS